MNHILPQTKARQPVYNFSATSATPKTTELRRPEDTSRDRPAVWYAPHVWDKMWFLIDACDQEVGWLGLVDTVEGGYLITDIFVPEQTVSGAETDIDADALAALAHQLIEEDRDTSQLFFWGHSHVNMATHPSGQDEEQIDEYLQHSPVFIRGIYNKRGQSKVDVFDTTVGLVHQCVDDLIYTPGLTAAETQELESLITRNVIEDRRCFLPAPTHARRPPKANTLALAANNVYAAPSYFGPDDDDDELSIWPNGWAPAH